jgi:hypothetical protein
MALLLVDDRDGRIVAELSDEQAVRVLEAMASEDAEVLEYLCLVESRSNHGALLGSDTSVKIRALR